MTDQSSIQSSIQILSLDEIYHLDTQSLVEFFFLTHHSTGLITGLSTVSILGSISLFAKDTKFYFTRPSKLDSFSSYFSREPLNEETPFQPMSPDASAVFYGYWINRIHKQGYGIFASKGILFNNISNLGVLEFVTRKVANSVAKIELGLLNKIVLVNISLQWDLEYATEYVEAMRRILQLEVSGDYIFVTAETNSIKKFLKRTCNRVSIDSKDFLLIQKGLIRLLELPFLMGNYLKISQTHGWHPKTKFDKLVNIMVGEKVHK